MQKGPQSCCISQLRRWGALFETQTTKTNAADSLADRKLLLLTRSEKSKMSALDVDDFLQQNRALADKVETFRGYWESDKHWQARREFILRNLNEEMHQLDHLLSLSMVWANNVFLGCRYVMLNTTCLLCRHSLVQMCTYRASIYLGYFL